MRKLTKDEFRGILCDVYYKHWMGAFMEQLPYIKGRLLNSGVLPEVAEDVCQDVFLAGWQLISTGRFRMEADLRTVMFRIVHFKFMDTLRDKYRRAAESLTEGLVAEPSQATEDLYERWLRVDSEIIKGMTPRQKTALSLLIGGLGHSDIAQAMGISRRWSHSLVGQAKRHMLRNVRTLYPGFNVGSVI